MEDPPLQLEKLRVAEQRKSFLKHVVLGPVEWFACAQGSATPPRILARADTGRLPDPLIAIFGTWFS
jgi:hypothetical protein